MSGNIKQWMQFTYNTKYLQLNGTLNGGQSFRWKKDALGQWIGVFQSKLWILRENDKGIEFQVHEPEPQEPEHKLLKMSVDAVETHLQSMLANYFHFDIDLEKHYSSWCEADSLFKSVSKDFYGIRVLRQEVIENIFAFICSSNNHISRISSMVEKLAVFYGDFICEYNGEKYFAFPKVERLAEPGVAATLRANGFGYRSDYIAKSAQIICTDTNWIEQLRAKSYLDAKDQLMALLGVGAKVADCVCLMSLDHLSSIPVDTHVYQIAAKYYLPSLPKKKIVSEKHYKDIGNKFRDVFGPLAGWAQTVLFCADLKKLQEANG